MSFKEVDVYSFSFNPSSEIGDLFWLVCAGNKIKKGCMTASWGQIGSLWGRKKETKHFGLPTITIFVRPQRYTDSIIKENDYFSICVFPSKYRKELLYLGSHSFRNEDKLAKVGFHPIYIDGTLAIEEASKIYVCKKLYVDKLKEDGFVDKEIPSNNYPNKDFHNVYIGEIVKTYIKE
ncbi:MAG: flavin reductase family protein [Candidatus Enteromonas sp.]|nr:flavin reductase family protein [Candidatus Enteromonas sp.]